MSQKLSVLKLADQLRTEADAYEFLEDLRWGDRPVCPHCGSIRKPYFLKPSNGKARKTRTGSVSERRVWKCADCRKQFSVLTGTIMHGTKIEIRKWVLVMFEMAACKNGMSAREIQRKYDVTAEAAWFMAHRLREAMKREPMAGLLSGRIVADEAWIGGKPSNRHRGKREVQGKTDKVPVMTLVSRETGEARSTVVQNVRRDAIRKVLREHVDVLDTHLHTDEAVAYEGLTRAHSSVDHKAGEYVRGDVTTNHAETYFSQLKRSIDGTHHHVSREHLHRYLAEFDFRYSTCKETDEERMGRLIGRVGGRRLTYRKPTQR